MSDITGSPGQVLADRYKLVTLIGRGGMGCVWRAQHLTLGTPVVIKLIHATVAARPGMLARFLREARAAAVLKSLNVVHVLDHGVDDGTAYIAMELLEGESLSSRLDRERRLDAATTALVMTGVVRALSRAHRLGIVHRDLKPDNIFIAQDDSGPIVKVLDFGIAKMLEPVDLESETPTGGQNTDTGTLLGTPAYMSPEQARGKKELDARSDLWSLGVIAFECLVGRRPFDSLAIGELMMQICADPVPVPSSLARVPDGFDAWFARAVQRDPNARFQTVLELAESLADVLTPSQRWLEATMDSDATKARTLVSELERAPTLPFEGSVGGRPVSEGGVDATAAPAVLTSSRGARPWAPRVLGVVVLGTAAALAAAALSSRPGADHSVVAAGTASTPAASSSAAEASASSGLPGIESALRSPILVVPPEASVEVNGAPAPNKQGAVKLRGNLGSVHRVRVVRGDVSREVEISLTEFGPIPARVDLPSGGHDGRDPQTPGPAGSARPTSQPPVRPPSKPNAAPASTAKPPPHPAPAVRPREAFE